MPKCSLKPANYEDENRRIRATILYKQELKNVTTSELAVYAHMKLPTLYQRLQRPSEFRLRELRNVCKRLDINLAELIEGKECM